MLFGWHVREDAASNPSVLRDMAAALRVTSRQVVEYWHDGTLAIGQFRLPRLDTELDAPQDPARSADGRYALWMSGEVFTWDGETLAANAFADTTFRTVLMARLQREGADALRELNGEYQLALWDRERLELSLFTDRFGALPFYWAANARGFAFAGGVRGVLMAPGVDHTPDVCAIREAVTFGGYRLGSRTNVAAVKMSPPSAIMTYRDGDIGIRRYWSWHEAPTPEHAHDPQRLGTIQEVWRRAIAARLRGSRRPGLLLSGGLDSRAVLAESARQAPRVAAISYGVPQSDDVRFGRRAARAAGAEWELFPLYAEGWLDRRLSHVMATDGLLNLVDLMHMEVLPQVADRMDVYLSGYLGDTASGGNYLRIKTAADLLHALPYYGGTLGLPPDEATSLATEMIAATSGDPMFAMYEHKLPQAISRITEAARPWVRVRRPFTDYDFWAHAQRVPRSLRDAHKWHEQWLRQTYPRLFARIPHQRTGAPAGVSGLRYEVTRAARFGWRRALALVRRAGVPVAVPERSYHPDWAQWRQRDIRDVLTRTILRPDSVAADIFGRTRLSATLDAFFEHDAAPTQVIGALFVYEQYHRSLPSAVRQWRQQGIQV